MIKELYLAGGCFWGMQGYFCQLAGIKETKVGYSNGISADTDYKNIKSTDHAEVIYLKYDDEVINFESIMKHYFRVIDPFSINKQGGDVGRQYRTGIYYVDEESYFAAKKYIEDLQKDFIKKNCSRSRKSK